MVLPDDSASSAEADDTRLRRPILRTALAIAGGSWLGAVHALDRAAVCALIGTLIHTRIGAVSIGVGALLFHCALRSLEARLSNSIPAIRGEHLESRRIRHPS